MMFVADHCASDVSSRLYFWEIGSPFVDLPATKAIFSGIRVDLSFTLQIIIADS